MEKMLECLENLLDEAGETEYEVDYGVCIRLPLECFMVWSPDCSPLERCLNAEVGHPWNLRDQQTASQ